MNGKLQGCPTAQSNKSNISVCRITQLTICPCCLVPCLDCEIFMFSNLKTKLSLPFHVFIAHLASTKQVALKANNKFTNESDLCEATANLRAASYTHSNLQNQSTYSTLYSVEFFFFNGLKPLKSICAHQCTHSLNIRKQNLSFTEVIRLFAVGIQIVIRCILFALITSNLAGVHLWLIKLIGVREDTPVVYRRAHSSKYIKK